MPTSVRYARRASLQGIALKPAARIAKPKESLTRDLAKHAAHPVAPHARREKMEEKEIVYMVCDWTDERAAAIDDAPNIGVEHMGDCRGRILREDGSEIGHHCSSSFGWLRADLKRKLDDPDKYNIVDLIGQPVPVRFEPQSEWPDTIGLTTSG